MDALKFLASQRNWECKLSSEGIKIYAPSQTQAMWACEEFFDDLALTALKFYGKVTLSSVQNPDFSIEIHDFMWRSNTKDIMNNIVRPKIYLGEVKIYTPQFLYTLASLTEGSGERLGLVRVQDNLQIAVTAGMSAHLGSFDLQPNTKVKREEYWYLPDLHEFTRVWQRDLSENGVLEFKYKALTNAVINKTDWSQFTTRYKLIRDGNEYYHYAQILDVASIAAPAA